MKRFYSLILYLFFTLKAFSFTHLYEIEYQGIKSNLFGTSHMTSFTELPQAIQNLIKNREVLITENMDILKPLTKSLAAQIDFLKVAGENDHISALAKESKIELSKFVQLFLKVKRSEVSIDELNLKGLLATYMAGHFIEGMDYYLVEYFKDKFGNISVMGLEDLQQISTFFEEVTLDELRNTLKFKISFESSPDFLKDVEYLQELEPETDEFFSSDIKDRNTSWLPKIIEYHLTLLGKKIFCVGYKHLYGEHGLLNLLINEGCTIKRVNSEGTYEDYQNMAFLLNK